ncbi:MAG: gamma-glutamylcyclotransferase family protein, partial [Pseudomonadota bacterium]
MKPIFFFGTLRDPELLAIVLGRALRSGDVRPARAEGVVAWQVAGEAYPMLRIDETRAAEGVLFFPAARDDVEALRFYEEAEYDLLPISVHAGAEAHEALYFGATGKLSAGAGAWDYEGWRHADRAVALAAAAELMPLRET